MKPNALLLLISALIPSSYATTFVQMPFPETVEKTPYIVRGTIGSKDVRAVQMKDGAERVFTYYQLNIAEVIKGTIKRTPILIRSLGGELPGTGLSIAGAVSFNSGEDVVVMLMEENPDSSFDVRSLMMGKMTLQKDADGNEMLAGPLIDSYGEHKVHSPGSHPDPAPSKKWSLKDLKEIVRSQGYEGVGPDSQAKQEVTSTPTSMPTSAPSLQPSPAGPEAGRDPGSKSESKNTTDPSIFWYGIAVAVFFVGLGILRMRS